MIRVPRIISSQIWKRSSAAAEKDGHLTVSFMSDMWDMTCKIIYISAITSGFVSSRNSQSDGKASHHCAA